MKYKCALITVSDMKRSRAFYEDLLEQEVENDYGENVSYIGGFAIHLQSHFQQLIPNKYIRQGGNNFELYFEFNDVEELASRLKEHSVEWIHDVLEQPWRQKVIRFYDPDQHIIEVGESMEFLAYRLFKEGKEITEISGITYLPESKVSEAIQQFNSD